MNNEDDDFDMVFWVINIFMLILVVTSVYTLIYIVHSQDISSNELELDILINGVHNSDAYLYQDNLTKRVYSGIIDLEKFQKIDLSKSIYTEAKTYALKIDVYVDDKEYTKYFVAGKEDTEENYRIKASLKSFDNRVVTKHTEKNSLFYINGEIKEGLIAYWALKEI